jgi:DEAD/DEAH box helicase domain-containing protein
MDEQLADGYIDDAENALIEFNTKKAASLINKVLKHFPSNKRIKNLLEKYPEVKLKITNNSTPPIDQKEILNRLIQEILNHKGIWNKIVGYRSLSSSKGETGTLPPHVDEKIALFFRKSKRHPYSHQVELFNKIDSGSDVIISTPTASGKTFSFALPIFNDFIKNENHRAIFIYPTKALINDQKVALNDLEEEIGIQLFSRDYHGDTPDAERDWNLKKSRIILTNPDMIHWHLKDPDFLDYLKNVMFIVIDEAHTYRGVFGTNVSFLIRRIRRLCKYYGNDPQFILATATLGNPEEFSEWLVGKKFTLVEKSGAPRGEKHIFLYNPFKNVPVDYKKSSSQIFKYFVEHQIQTLCFSISRIDAEIIREKTLELLNPGITSEEKKDNRKIIAYRGGFGATERKILEEGLKKGEITGCSTTNALEVGIDLGTLNAVIVSGYPGSIMSTWQQFGRAGRGITPAIDILVTKQDALDQLFAQDPDYFFSQDSEDAIVAGKNPYIKNSHILCAANEMAINLESDSKFFNELEQYSATVLPNMSDLKISGNFIRFSGNYNPATKINLRNCSQEIYFVICNGKKIEKMDKLHAYREGHEKAIILHQGSKYYVKKIDTEKHFIEVDEVNVPYYTRSIKDLTVKILNTKYSCSLNGIGFNFGDLLVTERIISFKKIPNDGNDPGGSVFLPDLKYDTKGIWITFPDDVFDLTFKEDIYNDLEKDESKSKPPNILLSLNGLKNSILPVFTHQVKADTRDIGSAIDKDHNDTGSPTLFFYDAVEGGIGFSEYAFKKLDKILNKAINRILTCDCKDGCLGCIYSHWFNQPSDKRTTIILSKWLKNEIEEHGDFEKIIHYSLFRQNNGYQIQSHIIADTVIPKDPLILDILNETNKYVVNNSDCPKIPNIFPEIEKIVCEGLQYSTINEYLENQEKSLIAVKSLIDTNIQPYAKIELQYAYILLYYPYYIETITRELTAISSFIDYNQIPTYPIVNIFCCGPAPEYFGLLNYFSSSSRTIQTLDIHLFEKENWEDTRNKCISHLSPILLEQNQININIFPHTGFDFFSLANHTSYDSFPSLKSSQIYIFQNCLRDLKIVANSMEKLIDSIRTLLEFMEKGSFIVFIDLNYSDIQKILYKIRDMVINNSEFVILRENIYPILFYNTLYRRSDILESFLKEKIYSGSPRKRTKYRSLVIGRV